jgi:hypothetical protein
MRIITALLAIMILVVGCGPHFLGKPEPYVPPQPPSATPAAVAPAPAPQNVTLTIPNWPVTGYSTDGAILILLVRDPKTFPVPGEFTFTRPDGSAVTMKQVQPDKPPEKGKAK